MNKVKNTYVYCPNRTNKLLYPSSSFNSIIRWSNLKFTRINFLPRVEFIFPLWSICFLNLSSRWFNWILFLLTLYEIVFWCSYPFISVSQCHCGYHQLGSARMEPSLGWFEGYSLHHCQRYSVQANVWKIDVSKINNYLIYFSIIELRNWLLKDRSFEIGISNIWCENPQIGLSEIPIFWFNPRPTCLRSTMVKCLPGKQEDVPCPLKNFPIKIEDVLIQVTITAKVSSSRKLREKVDNIGASSSFQERFF